MYLAEVDELHYAFLHQGQCPVSRGGRARRTFVSSDGMVVERKSTWTLARHFAHLQLFAFHPRRDDGDWDLLVGYLSPAVLCGVVHSTVRRIPIQFNITVI